MKQLIRVPKAVLTCRWRSMLAFLALLFASYFSTATYAISRAEYLSPHLIDIKTPLLTWMVWFYFGYYLLVPLTFFLSSIRDLSRVFFSYSLATIISCIVFFIYPTKIVRAQVSGSSFSDFVVTILYEMDAPTNCFPSLHVSLAVLAAIYIARSDRLSYFSKLIGCAFAAGVCLSTVAIKQHYVIDVLGGFCVALLAFYCSTSLLENRSNA